MASKLSKRKHYTYCTISISVESLNSRYTTTALSARRSINDATFIYKGVRSQINCSQIVQELNFALPRVSLRNYPTFHVRNICKSNPVSRGQMLLNSLSHHSDIFCDSFSRLRNALLTNVFLPQN